MLDTNTTQITQNTNSSMVDQISFSSTSVIDPDSYFGSMKNDPDLAPPKLKRSYCEEYKIMEKICKEFKLDYELDQPDEVGKFTKFILST